MAAGFKMDKDAIYFVPLGGCGVFGANMSLYGYQGKWIMVDCGMGFADDTMPGVDVLLPSIQFAQQLGEDLLGIILTHGHEDHIGAIGHHWPKLRVPMYATPFTAELIKEKGAEHHWDNQVKLHVVPLQGHVDIGPFGIDFIRMAHSIPESNALAIEAKGLGTVLHTGDWKIDPAPMEGEMTDGDALQKLGDRGVMAMMCDSTNAMVPGHSPSEKIVSEGLKTVIGEFHDGIILTCFASNVTRFRSIYEAAAANGRQVCLVGRSMLKIDEAARKTGYLKGIPPFLTRDTVGAIPSSKLVYICTGSQGEPRAAMAKIANDDHPFVEVMPDDVVVFSSRDIPGNMPAIERMRNKLIAAGVNVVTPHDAPVHASGHPYRDELKQMYKWVRPRIAIPVHGEAMQMEKNASLAEECGVRETLVPVNGNIIRISHDGAEIVGEAPNGMLAVEGNRLVAIDHEAILTRKRMMFNGSAVVTVVIDSHGKLVAEPKLTALGLLDENSDLDAQYIEDVIRDVKNVIKNMPKEERGIDAVVSETVRVTVRRFFNERFDRKPQTRVHLVRI